MARKWNGQYNPFHCPICGRFCAGAIALENRLDEINKIVATCKRHGVVDVTHTSEWSWEMFFPGNAW